MVAFSRCELSYPVELVGIWTVGYGKRGSAEQCLRFQPDSLVKQSDSWCWGTTEAIAFDDDSGWFGSEIIKSDIGCFCVSHTLPKCVLNCNRPDNGRAGQLPSAELNHERL